MSGRRARARTATKARAMKGDARAARRIYLRFNRSKRAGATSSRSRTTSRRCPTGRSTGHLLSHATAAYWSCKVAQNGGAK